MAQVQDAHPQEWHSTQSLEAETLESQAVVPNTDTVGAAREQHATLKRQPSELVCVHYGGRQFIATYEMAGIFLRRAQRLIDAEDAELVPLVFEGGLELLYVSSAMPFSVHDADAEPADGSHQGPAATT
ncbi:MAG: hypothetical protein ABI053_00675 [Lacisediminihabitans sp.]